MHGSAPDIAGKDLANPIAAILSAGMLLRYALDLPEEADAIDRAVERTLAGGLRAADLARAGGESVGTRAMGNAIVEELERELAAHAAPRRH